MLNANTLFDTIFSEINLFYAHAAGVGTGIVMAITKLYAGRRDEFSKAYGTILLSVSIFLMTRNNFV